jgi:hypothetical protein
MSKIRKKKNKKKYTYIIINRLFLYLMELTEGEFLQVKKEQNLHVDFSSFP